MKLYFGAYRGISRSQKLAEYLRRQIIEAECPACHGLLERGLCRCCGSFEASSDRVFLAKGVGDACSHWPIQIAEDAIKFNAYLNDDTGNYWFDFYVTRTSHDRP